MKLLELEKVSLASENASNSTQKQDSLKAIFSIISDFVIILCPSESASQASTWNYKRGKQERIPRKVSWLSWGNCLDVPDEGKKIGKRRTWESEKEPKPLTAGA